MGQHWLNSHDRSIYHDINDAYNRPSYDKVVANSACKKLCLSEGGIDYKIISKNTFSFTAGWRTAKGLRVETNQNSYIIIDK